MSASTPTSVPPGRGDGSRRRRFPRVAAFASGILLAAVGCSAAPLSAPTTAPAGTPAAGTPGGDRAVTIYLARHGTSLLNALDRTQGWADSPLIASGRDQAEDLGEGLRLAGVDLDAAYSADMVRHYETATLALDAGDYDLQPTRDERLREIAFGPFEGGSNATMWSAVAEEMGYPDAGALWADMPRIGMLEALDHIEDAAGETRFPVETSAEVGRRALASIDDIASDQAEAGGGEVLVVTSGFTVMCVLDALGADLGGTLAIDNAAVSELRFDDGAWTVETMNDTSYREAGASA